MHPVNRRGSCDILWKMERSGDQVNPDSASQKLCERGLRLLTVTRRGWLCPAASAIKCQESELTKPLETKGQQTFPFKQGHMVSVLPIDLLSPSSETMDRSGYYWQWPSLKGWEWSGFCGNGGEKAFSWSGRRLEKGIWKKAFLLRKYQNLLTRAGHAAHICSVTQRVHLFVTPWTAARQPPLSMGFSKQEFWSGLPFPIPGDLPNPGIKPVSLSSPALAGGLFTTSAAREAWNMQFSSVQSLRQVRLCDPMDCSMPDFPVHHQFPERAQTHVHWVGDAIQPSQPLSYPSPAFNLFQHQGLFQWVSSSNQVAKYWNFSFSISPSNGHSGLGKGMANHFSILALRTPWIVKKKKKKNMQ